MTSAKISTFVLLIFLNYGEGSKYSEELNRPISELNDPFRMMKVNLLWHKAKQNLPEKKLVDLYTELKMHDKKEGDLKKMKLSGLDEDGLKSAQLEEKFMEIVVKYGLNHHYKYEQGEESETSGKKRPQQLKDPKLKDLWHQASSSGFSENELKALKQELSHHQNKLDEYHALKDEIDRFQETEHNMVDSEDYDEYKLKKKNVMLKSKHRDLKSNFQKLQELASDPELATEDFSDLRVYQLWSMAKKSNMSHTELNSLREELRHFEHRLKKQEFFKEQLSLSEKSLDGQVKDGDFPEAHVSLEQKVKDYDYKVKKLHTDLKIRITQATEKHSEL
ncbi:alpha-2-macroglobulin receptor-associated protein-like [Liolophura sinensis]|uniref:alpha-2-macroglobulin receptor-associated protein-like n=1 Tax=Liolophura sinensis TaxID=3198878 RepID=UPI0031588477